MTHNFRLKNGALVEFNAERCKIIINKMPGEPEEVTLARADARILELLLMNPGAICSREAIQEFAWEERVVSTGSLNQSIFMLRNVLGDSKDHEILITVPRRGYRFNSDYLLSEPPTAAQSIATPAEVIDPETAAPKTLPVRKQGVGKAVQLGYLVAAAFVLASLWRVYTWYAPVSELHVAVIQQGELTISAVGKSEREVKKLKSDVLSADISKENIKGEIFISRTGVRTNISCIRENGRTNNIEFKHGPEQLMPMLKKCMVGE